MVGWLLAKGRACLLRLSRGGLLAVLVSAKGWQHEGRERGREDGPGHRRRDGEDEPHARAAGPAQGGAQERGPLPAHERHGDRGEVQARRQGVGPVRRDGQQAEVHDHVHQRHVQEDPRRLHVRPVPGRDLHGLQGRGPQEGPRRPEEAPRGLQGEAGGGREGQHARARRPRGRGRALRGGAGRGGVTHPQGTNPSPARGRGFLPVHLSSEPKGIKYHTLNMNRY